MNKQPLSIEAKFFVKSMAREAMDLNVRHLALEKG